MIQNLYSILVNWNLKEDTLACIESLLEAGASLEQVILVDNASTDGSVEALRERFGPRLEMIVNKRNLGYAGGVNQGVQRALQQEAEWIFLLNNDTTVDRLIFTEFERAAEAHPEYPILAPLILYQADPARIWYLGDRLIPGTLITRSLYRGQIDHGQLPAFLPVDFVSGCGMLVRSEVFAAIGLFDESLFMYGEEVDFCWRARQVGFRLGCATRAKMWHRVSVSADRVRPQSRRLRVRNQARFYRKYARGLQIPLMFGFTLVRCLAIGVGDLLKGQPELIAPLATGWYAGWFERQTQDPSQQWKP